MVLINITGTDLDLTLATPIYNYSLRQVIMFCLFNQAHCPRMNFCGMPQYHDNRIPGGANRILSGAYCDLSDVSSCIIKISLVFFYTGHLFLGVLFVLAVGTQFVLKLPFHHFYWCLNDDKHTVGRTVKD